MSTAAPEKKQTLFASRGIVEHLLRGTIGFGALVGALFCMASQPWLAVALAAVALFALRGCPLCWVVGLVETIAAKLQGRDAHGRCSGGACLRPGERDQ
jgi:hypothetical protein